MIVDPSGEQGSFHRGRPRLRESLHPKVQTHPRGWNRAFPVNLPAAILHTVTDRFFVNIQADVIHTFHGGASLACLCISGLAEFSLCTPSAPPDSYIQTIRQQSYLG